MKRTRVIRAFKRNGWYVRPTKKGKEHTVLIKDGVDAILSIPRHSTIKQGTLNKLIKLAGLTVEEFLALSK
jgi:predicted RNA binding protein YcfA (HicA-like mRNA interferase family)